jgi:hypothetical protein
VRYVRLAIGFLAYWLTCIAIFAGISALALGWVYVMTGFRGVIWIYENGIIWPRLFWMLILPGIVLTLSAAATLYGRRSRANEQH